ncbi:MAG: methylated-DNA--[protein]-cysteine S-methyltransferase [Sulfurospirillaceae bacterium]|nr:methylated-DNA--[protein]-cysteine S-methyltransferase [Sulfurospirillaceae bacterium]
MAKASFHSLLGKLVAEVDESGVCSLGFDESSENFNDEHPFLKQLEEELKEYFMGERTTFDVPLNPKGTEFQRVVWSCLCSIPYGHTISYTQEAKMIKRPTAMRAVANANGKNPIAIIIPCHRVIAKDRSLGGYSGGLWRKEFLLDLEKKTDESCYSNRLI